MNLTEPFALMFSHHTPWKTRLVYFLIIVGVSFWIDSQMGFTYHYFTERKINAISKYSTLIKDPQLDSTTKTLLIKERLSVIQKSRAMVEPIARTTKPNGIIFHLSYSWMFILLIILGPLLLRKGDPYASRKEINNHYLYLILASLICCVVTYLIAKAASFYLTSTGLYIFNTLVQLIILIIITVSTSNKK